MTPGGPRAGTPIVVWDLPIRLFHWLVAVLVAAAYVTERLNWMDWHMWVGAAVLALVLFRLAWGFIGSDTARFARFLASPGAAARHLSHLFRREPDAQIGHNPAGGWMVLLLLGLLLGETLTGIVTNNDVADEGPLTGLMPAWLANLITDLHKYLWYALLAAVLLHVLAIAAYAAKGHRLVPAMVTGRKRLPAGTASPRLVSPAFALPALAVAAGVAALLTDRL